ncbi:MAG: DUF4238 domain-containing protein [Sedimentisphaerales bacterium]|nr:DUF4238 domain-containing protein [Sedimentisphaerales bacterium]
MNQCPKKKRSKRQHIISRLYLKNFSVDEKVWVIDFHSDREPYITNVTNVLCVSDFFTVRTKENPKDDIFEKNFSRIETEVKPILDNLLEKMVIPEGKDKEKLAGYLACLFLMGPRTRQVQLELYESAANWFSKFYLSKEDNFDKLYKEHKAKHPESKITEELARKITNSMYVEVNIPREEYIKNFFAALAIIEPLFNKMVLKILWADPLLRQRFVTGDFPFVIYDKSNNQYGMPKNWGLFNKNVEIFIPISPLVCFLLEFEGESMIDAIRSRDFIPLINSQLACAVSRYIISSSKEIFWFKKGKIYSSVDKLHKEFYHRKLKEPMGRISPSQTIVARRNWNKLKGDKPTEAKR